MIFGIKTKYKDWFPRMCEYGFSEDIDYRAIAQKGATAMKTLIIGLYKKSTEVSDNGGIQVISLQDYENGKRE